MSKTPATPSAGDFHEGAEVYSADGQHVGELAATILDEDSYSLRAVVVRESNEFSGRRLAPGSASIAGELLVPRDAVARAGRERVDLSLKATELRNLPPYLTYRRLRPTGADYIAQLLSPFGFNPAVPRYEVEARKPEGAIEVDSGEAVMLEGTERRIGEVEDVLFEGEELIGVVMKPEGWFEHPVILPRRFLGRSDDAALFARLTDEDLENLKPYEAS